MIQIACKSSITNAPDFGLAEQLFGDDFEVWVQDPEWRRIKTLNRRCGKLSVSFYVELFEMLRETAGTSQMKFCELDQDRALCLIPLDDSPEQHSAVALSIVDRSPDSLLKLAQRAAKSAVVQQQYAQQVRAELSDSNSRLAETSLRVDRGEGELAWLHGLAGSAALAAAENDSQKIAESILPEMCRLMNACTVAFVPFNSREVGVVSALAIWQFGDTIIPQETCRALIAEHGSTVETVVHNYGTPAFREVGYAGVLSCIVKKIVSQSSEVGWILAVNKDLQELGKSNVEAECVQEHCGFGHFEASLVDAAANTMAAHARNSRLLAEKEALVAGTVRLLVNAIDAKDLYTGGHSDRVAMYARQIAETMQLGDEFCDQIYLTGLVHDVGKIGVPDNILQKPGKLTVEEFESIKLHPVTGHAILQHLEDFAYVLPGVLHHHESVDGSGYPDGLVGAEIPLQARILAVADAYDAMTSDRPYRAGMPTQKAESIIARGAGAQWDVDCVAAFQQCIDRIRGVGCHRRSGLIPKPHYVPSGRRGGRMSLDSGQTAQS